MEVDYRCPIFPFKYIPNSLNPTKITNTSHNQKNQNPILSNCNVMAKTMSSKCKTEQVFCDNPMSIDQSLQKTVTKKPHRYIYRLL